MLEEMSSCILLTSFKLKIYRLEISFKMMCIVIANSWTDIDISIDGSSNRLVSGKGMSFSVIVISDGSNMKIFDKCILSISSNLYYQKFLYRNTS